MESRAKLFGHPLHQVLIVFPLGLLATAAVFDILYLVTGHGRWAGVSYWMIISGIVGGILAAPFGLIDWLAIPAGTRAKRIGLYHGAGNVLVLILFAASWLLRGDALREPGIAALAFSFFGIGLAMLTGWLGGELVARLAIGVDDGAHWDAPSSISRRPARERVSGATQAK